MKNEEEIAYALDEARAKGWESAREFFKEQVKRFAWDNYPATVFATINNNLDEMFENPEDEAKILREAALSSTGRP